MRRVIFGWALGLLVLAGAVFAYVRYREAHKPPPITFTTAKVERRRIVGSVTTSGTLQATVTVQVGTQVSGRIQKLFADFNSPVKKGQLVAKIDPQLFQATVDQQSANHLAAKARLERANAVVADAEAQLRRAQALSAQNLASAAELQAVQTNLATAKADVDVAAASLEQARAALNQAKVNLEYTNIVSPIDGVVLSRNVDVGQTVAASLQTPTLFTIAEDLRKMQVNTNVSEGDIGRLEAGMAASFTVDAYPGQRFKGRIGTIRNAPQTVQNVVTYDAVIDVDNAELKLKPGMTANVTIVYAQKDGALAVPNAALRFRPPAGATPSASGSASGGAAGGGPRGRGPRSDPETRVVWTLTDGQTLNAATVKAGISDGSFTEVEGPVNEGDLVVTDAAGPGTQPATPAGGSMPRRIF